MRYEGAVYRPPSEANSLIIQVTIGCSHNNCTYCSMFKDKKFKIRQLEDVFIDLESARKYYSRVEKIFLADADAMVLKTETLVKILVKIHELFPECKRITSYTTAKDILRKPLEELIKLRELGLSMVYLGVESGSNQVLELVNKGITASEMIEAGKRIKDSGILLSATLISGLGGQKHWRKHALESARVISDMDPNYLGLLTLTVDPGTEMMNQVNNGDIIPLTPHEVMVENAMLIENLELSNCILRSNHVCNYVPLAGTLNKDKSRLLRELNRIIEET